MDNATRAGSCVPWMLASMPEAPPDSSRGETLAHLEKKSPTNGPCSSAGTFHLALAAGFLHNCPWNQPASCGEQAMCLRKLLLTSLLVTASTCAGMAPCASAEPV